MLTAHVLLNVHQKLLWKTQTSRLEVYFHKYVQKIISPFKICTIARVELLHIYLHKKWGEFNCNLTLMHLHTFCPPVAIISTAGPQQFCMSISLWDVSRGFGCPLLSVMLWIHKPWLPTPSQLQRFPAAGWRSESRLSECHLAYQSSEHQHPAANNQSRNRGDIRINARQTDRCVNAYTKVFLTLSISTTVSAKPTTYMATATALAKAKMRPMLPPNSGPRLLEIR